ncbi:hypothetical protein JCM19235_4243 [Vibrio maritimus]|uniref:Uncharacterized protein n=1 Tax=Vibrio maritimus TaxID=990268 RepID=A0A090RZU5_9VIBR|nr:hypothetical protein JCM19235_4243 [Vibrio maritimus]
MFYDSEINDSLQVNEGLKTNFDRILKVICNVIAHAKY